jgi:predicted negative regulator of RcsB-dependent stress response
MKLDIKSILILVLLGFCLLFGYKWYFSTENSEYKKQVKDLRNKNKNLQRKRDSILLEINNLKEEFELIQKNDKLLRLKIDSLDNEIFISKLNMKKSESELKLIKENLLNNSKKIDSLKSNPPNRTGEDLLRSLKINTMK